MQGGLNIAAIPQEMKALCRWVTWKTETRHGKTTKTPYTPGTSRRAKCNDPTTWRTFGQAVAHFRAGKCDGIGFQLGEGYTGIDLDHCAPGGQVQSWAMDIVRVLASYTEYSPSGEGLHIIVKGELPQGRRRKNKVEMYDSGRYFTVTGHVLCGYAKIESRQSELDALHARLFPQESGTSSGYQPEAHPGGLDDDGVLRRAAEAQNGAKFSQLWAGDSSGYSSQSEADLALCSIIAFWAAADATQIDRLFRQSGLMRPKWDEKRSSTGTTYGMLTIQKAMEGTERYTPRIGRNVSGESKGNTVTARGRPRTVRLLTRDYIGLYRQWGYTVKLNLCNDDIEINGLMLDDISEDQINARVRDYGITHRLGVNIKHARETLTTLAAENAYHPVKDFLGGIRWDGKDHIRNLTEHFEDKDGLFAPWFAHWVVGSVAKLFDGYQNPMLVLDGPQELGKSYFVRWLCPLERNFNAGAIYPESKDCKLRLIDTWIWEVEELGSTTRKADLEALKAFLSTQVVRERKPYGHRDIVKPALASFVGTINNNGGFLIDRTGNRRFLVCSLDEIDWGYADDIDIKQIWAQAKAIYDNDQSWRLSNTDKRLRDENNEIYMVDDPVEAILSEIAEYTGNPEDMMTLPGLLSLLRDRCTLNQHAQTMAIASVFKAWGAHKSRQTFNGKRITVYRGVKAVF